MRMMKKAVAVGVIFLVVVVSCLGKSEDFLKFQKFIRQYDRRYESVDELTERFAVFRENVRKMELFDVEGGSGVEYGITKFMDWTEEEFASTFSGVSVDESDVQEVRDIPEIDGTVPTSYTWNGTWKVRPVQDQGKCGAGWAFAAAGEAEGHYSAIAGLSVQQLIDCDTYDDGCNGGVPPRGWRYIKWDAQGWENDVTYPYVGSSSSCSYSFSSSVYTVSSVDVCKQCSKAKIRRLIHNRGPVAAIVNSTPLQSYTGGIITASSCSGSPNHFVVIVGYDVDGKGNTYWIVKNSYGSDWGESGFFRIYTDACKISARIYLSS